MLKSSRLIVLVAFAVMLQSCAVITSPEATPAPGVSPLPSPVVTQNQFVSPLSPVPTPTPTSLAHMAPDFSLQRENGEAVRLSEMRDRSSVALVFYRGQT
jgi:hypothetical protein